MEYRLESLDSVLKEIAGKLGRVVEMLEERWYKKENEKKDADADRDEDKGLEMIVFERKVVPPVSPHIHLPPLSYLARN